MELEEYYFILFDTTSLANYEPVYYVFAPFWLQIVDCTADLVDFFTSYT